MVVSTAGQRQNCLGHCALGVVGGACQPLHTARDLLTRQLTFAGKAAHAPQDLQRSTDRFNQICPLDLADQSQRRDDVAHCQVGSDLAGLRILDEVQRIRAMPGDPAGQGSGVCSRRFFGEFRRGLPGWKALPQLGEKAALQAALLQRIQQLVKVFIRELLGCIPDGMGQFPRHLVPSDAVRDAAQVFQQHHAKGRRQCPQLTERQLIDFLIGL